MTHTTMISAALICVTFCFAPTIESAYAQGESPPCPVVPLFKVNAGYLFLTAHCDENNDCEELPASGSSVYPSSVVNLGCSPNKSLTGECVCNSSIKPILDVFTHAMPRGHLPKPLSKNFEIVLSKNQQGRSIGCINSHDHILHTGEGKNTKFYRTVTVVLYSKNFKKLYQQSLALEYGDDPNKMISHANDGTWKYSEGVKPPAASLANQYTLRYQGQNFTILPASPFKKQNRITVAPE